jgi:hypothetical protein
VEQALLGKLQFIDGPTHGHTDGRTGWHLRQHRHLGEGSQVEGIASGLRHHGYGRSNQPPAYDQWLSFLIGDGWFGLFVHTGGQRS